MTLHLLGTPRLAGAKLEPIRAALLAYLALEGEAPRARLTRMLWPDRPAKTARNNLRKHLSRLREEYPEHCIQGLDPLRLSEAVPVDVLLLRSAHDRGDYTSAIEYTGDLLADLTFDARHPADADELLYEQLVSWLRNRRQWVRDMQHHAHEQEIQRLERANQLPEALDLARRLCSMDDTLEEAWRAIMLLHLRMGHRSAALGAYQECRQVLQHELGVEPSEETRRLAREIERQDASAQRAVRPRRPQLPLGVVCPPLLVGREREWAELEAAWEARKPMFVFGEPGVGKSRLMAEFASAKGKWIRLEARPGDRHIPYATHVRNGRKLLQQRKIDRRPPLPAWAAEQLSRLLPELGQGNVRTPPREEKLRFLEAAAELFGDTCQDLDIAVFDDGQYIDPDSFELGIYIHNQLWLGSTPGRQEGGRPAPLILNGYRERETDPHWLDLINALVRAGLAARIEVRPLAEPDVREMLATMEVPGLEPLAGDVARYTGGNPLYVVETVKHLLRSGEAGGADPAALSLSDPVRQVIRARLKSLSSTALEIARVVAAAQTNTSLDVVSSVLQLPLLTLAEPYRELEEQGVLAREWFTHDVLGEVLLEEMPDPLRASLQRRIGDNSPITALGYPCDWSLAAGPRRHPPGESSMESGYEGAGEIDRGEARDLRAAACAAHQTMLLGVARRLLGDRRADAMDYVQETMVRFLERFPEAPPPEPWCGAWLMTALKNLLHSERRKHEVRQRSLSDPGLWLMAAPREEDPPDAVMDAIAGETFQGAVVSLTPKLRAAYELHALGASYDEIAQRLRISPGAVGKRLHDARRSLRALLETQLAGRVRGSIPPRARPRPVRTRRGMRPAPGPRMEVGQPRQSGHARVTLGPSQ